MNNTVTQDKAKLSWIDFDAMCDLQGMITESVLICTKNILKTTGEKHA